MTSPQTFEPKFLEGKLALVTCSSKGIGFSIAEALADAGAELIICSRDRDPGTLAAAHASLQTHSGAPVSSVRCDLSQAEGILELLSHIHRVRGRRSVDILVSNSPHPHSSAGLQGIAHSDLSRALNGCVTLPFQLCQALAPQMAASQWGRIILLSSCYAKHPVARFYLSSFIRPCVSNLAKLLAEEYSHRGVVSSAMLLGYYATSLTDSFPKTDINIATALRLAPQHALPQPSLLAKFIVSLCSDSGFLINGSDVLLDYGYLSSRTEPSA